MRIGIDLGGTNIAAAVVDDNYKIIAHKSVPTLSKRGSAAVIDDMSALALELIQTAGLTLEDIETVGVGSPGTLDKDTGFVLYSNNIKWEHVDLRGGIQKRIDKPVFVDNDANCAAIGEFLAGASRGFSSSVLITLGTGIGGGIIIDKKILSGFNSAANSVGHTTLISGGELCTCGRLGCWESYASVTGLIRMANDVANEHAGSALALARERDGVLNGKNIFAAAKTGDAPAKELIDRYTFYVAEGITNLVNILEPEAVILGGGLSSEGDYLLNPIKEYLKRDVFCKYVALPQLKIAQLGNDAGIVGAAFLNY